MAAVTYYVAIAFIATESGDLVTGQAIQCQTRGSAVRAAERLAKTFAGAIAFSRTGDPTIGEFEDAVVIERFGEVDDAVLMRGP